MVANQTECSRFEQRSVMKFLVAEKCKTCMMCMEKCVLVQKNAYKFVQLLKEG